MEVNQRQRRQRHTNSKPELRVTDHRQGTPTDLRSYLDGIAILLIVLSPLRIPVAVTLCHPMANSRRHDQLFRRSRLGRGALRPAD
jgi:hypothetical protein